MIALGLLKGLTDESVISHLINNYSGKVAKDTSYDVTDDDRKDASDKLKNMELLVAHESNLDYDSYSFFLFKRKTDGMLFEINASHCSCYGFTGQLELEETSIEGLKYRAMKGSILYCIDGEVIDDEVIIKDYILSL